MTTGERLRKLRGNRSQAEVAKDLLISDSALSAYEQDDRTPRDEVKTRIAAYYGQSVQDIFFTKE